ncbi:MipA/OmpV family protein [uncultured Cedecea sp.]|uniref:MipA/OmpV family protein n=1 Tax=uncultured Cedecea sp. TaxID=988762 RepID=UPI002627E2D3|nr:MipA/OmpV family protein [uncultured Cedecea sp.]
MRNINLHNKSPSSLSGLSLKKILPGVVLILLAPPVLAAEQKQSNELTLGGGVDIAPYYSGSEKSRVTTALVLDYSTENGLFVSSTRGLGYGNNIGKFNYSAALSYRAGRKDRDVDSNSMSGGSNYLRGMGDIKGSAIGIPTLGYEISDWINVQLQAEIPISELDNGTALHFGIVSPLYQSSNSSVTLTFTGSWGTSKYMQTYYGVSTSQSANSGFKRYDAGSGIFAWSTNIDWTYKISQDWSVITGAGFTQLTGDAHNSPIVQRKTSPTGSLKVAYSF